MPARRFWRDASGRLTFCLNHVESADYAGICRTLADAFGLVAEGQPLSGFDEVYWDYRRADQDIQLAWDNWMGFTVTAKSAPAEPLVQEIALWLAKTQWGQGPVSP